jgi:hypothetical protein
MACTAGEDSGLYLIVTKRQLSWAEHTPSVTKRLGNSLATAMEMCNPPCFKIAQDEAFEYT